MLEKNDIYWYLGLRRMQPIPYKYIIPPLYFLKGKIKPKEKVIIKIPAKKKEQEQPYLKTEGQLF